jgi:hypothetical protein
VVYLRGFALAAGEIDETTADPFNGFNVGSVLAKLPRRAQLSAG